MRLLAVIFLPFVIISCTLDIEEEIVAVIPSIIPLEDMSGESIRYTLRVFTGSEIRNISVPVGTKRVPVKVKKGSTVILALYPAENYAPLGSYYEPGSKKEVYFTYTRGSLMDFLLSVSTYRSGIVRSLCLSSLEELYPDFSSIDKALFLSALEGGILDEKSEIEATLFEIRIESLSEGLWQTENPYVDDIRISGDENEKTVKLYEGVYRFLNIEEDRMLTLLVLSDGQKLEKISKIEKWF